MIIHNPVEVGLLNVNMELHFSSTLYMIGRIHWTDKKRILPLLL